jgi:hypothetical protein
MKRISKKMETTRNSPLRLNNFNSNNNDEYQPIKMNINNSSNHQSKINVNFSININCDRVDTLYESFNKIEKRQESDIYYDIPTANKKYEQIFNFKTLDIEESQQNVVLESLTTNSQKGKSIQDIKFKMENEIDLTFLRQNLKTIHLKVFYF